MNLLSVSSEATAVARVFRLGDFGPQQQGPASKEAGYSKGTSTVHDPNETLHA